MNLKAMYLDDTAHPQSLSNFQGCELSVKSVPKTPQHTRFPSLPGPGWQILVESVGLSKKLLIMLRL